MDKKKILVVDDEPSIISFLTRMLSAEYTVYQAKNGQQAVDNVKKHKPDLIIMDIMMPEMDGYTACALIKGDPSTTMIPIIMLTGVDFDLNKKMAMRMGANAYLTKPFSLIDLKKTMDPLLKS